MMQLATRRQILTWLPIGLAGVLLGLRPSLALAQAEPEPSSLDYFPSRNPKLAADMVGLAHRDIEKVEALLKSFPTLANAAIDWGFGDWESAIGAAAHTGGREMAELLISHGARPDLFTHAMLGHLQVVKAAVEARPGIQGIPGPHGLTLLHHARAGGDESAAVVSYLESVGGADPVPQPEHLELPVESYTGDYRFAPGPAGVIAIQYEKEKFRLKAGKGGARNLVYLRDHRFHPVGAPTVSIAFKVEEQRATEFTIVDSEPLLTALRVS